MPGHRIAVEKRRHERARVDFAVELVVKGSDARLPARARDVSVGGMQVEASTLLPVSTEVVAHITFPGEKRPLAMPAVVRWAREGGIGLQFGLLGARETHAITEAMSAAERQTPA